MGHKEMSAHVPDGLSNTIFLAHMYGTCGNGGPGSINASTEWGSLWADSNSIWRPGFNLGANKNGVVGYPPAPLFQLQPNFTNNCNPTVPQSPHTAGMLVGLGDGSVRVVSASISAATWATACNPQDGMVLGSDW
jgi:hypothetical protein